MQPAVSSRNDGIAYTEQHLHRAKAIVQWLECRPTLADMADRVRVLGDKAFDVPDPYADVAEWPEDMD